MNLTADRIGNGTMAEINVTPFTDVLLVLLIIFVVLSALVAPAGFEKRLPNGCETGCAAHAAHHPAIAVAVSPAGLVTVEGRAVDEPGLYAALEAAAHHDRKTTVRFLADAKAPYRLVIRPLDAAAAAGLDDVSFVTQ